MGGQEGVRGGWRAEGGVERAGWGEGRVERAGRGEGGWRRRWEGRVERAGRGNHWKMGSIQGGGGVYWHMVLVCIIAHQNSNVGPQAVV